MALAFSDPFEGHAVFLLEPILPPPYLREEFVQSMPARGDHVADDLTGMRIDPPISMAGAPGEDVVGIDPAGTFVVGMLCKAAWLPACPIK
jgi:hypothetical protein